MQGDSQVQLAMQNIHCFWLLTPTLQSKSGMSVKIGLGNPSVMSDTATVYRTGVP